MDEIFKKMQNVSGMAHDILVLGYDKDITDHHTTLCRISQICRKEHSTETNAISHAQASFSLGKSYQGAECTPTHGNVTRQRSCNPL